MRIHLFVLLVALVACNFALYSNCEAPSQDGSSKETTILPTRARFVMPKLFDFGPFKETFGKTYSSFMEELSRKRIYLARMFAAFISSLNYKNGNTSSYLSINQMSDWTPEERAQLLIPKSQMSPKSNEPASRNPFDEHRAEIEHEHRKLHELEQAFEEMEAHKLEPEYKELASELDRLMVSQVESSTKARNKRDADAGSWLVPGSSGTPANRLALKRSGDPKALADDGDEEWHDALESQPDEDEWHDALDELPETRVKRGAEDQEEWHDALEEQQPDEDQWYDAESQLPDVVQEPKGGKSGSIQEKEVDVWHDAESRMLDEVFVDHREKNCFPSVKNQARCGSCFIFAAIALYEYRYCMQTRIREVFSEQYLVDCLYENGQSGCSGGTIDLPVKFINEFGLELSSSYPYKAKSGGCPLRDQALRPDKWGFIKPNRNAKTLIISYKTLVDRIQESPIIFSIRVSDKFLDYGGGVDDNENCDENDNHAMLLIGHGREDGKEYLLFRNSYSVRWGEEGYYKMNIEALERCKSNTGAIMTDAMFKDDGWNKRYGAHPILAARA